MQIDKQTSKQRGTSTPAALDIELLALDLNSCNRCVGTLQNVEKAINTIRPVLDVMEVGVNVKRTLIESEEQARQHQFATSPTVRVNGSDIAFETLESTCDACTELSGCDEGTSCRVWRYRGQEYTEAPVGLVVESVLREILDIHQGSIRETPEYCCVPENLRRFFRNKSGAGFSAESCCPQAEQETCCEPGQGAAHGDASQSKTCGCR
jgi:hypothetical protein